MSKPEVYIVSAVRTAIGTFGGALKDVPLSELATTAVKAALQRSDLDPALVGHVVMGNVIATDTQDAYLSRVAAMNAGIPKETPAYNVNRLCGSGLAARRRRSGHRGRRRIHEPRSLPATRRPLGCAHGQCAGRRLYARHSP